MWYHMESEMQSTSVFWCALCICGSVWKNWCCLWDVFWTILNPIMKFSLQSQVLHHSNVDYDTTLFWCWILSHCSLWCVFCARVCCVVLCQKLSTQREAFFIMHIGFKESSKFFIFYRCSETTFLSTLECMNISAS